MRSNTRKLRNVLVKAVVVVSLVGAGIALADISNPARPGGGYVEPVIIRPMPLDSDFSGGGAFGTLPMF